MKTNVLLALVDQKSNIFKALVNDYTQFFSKAQGSFKGYKKTYVQAPDTADEPSMRGNVQIVTTVEEKLNWFKEIASDYLSNKLSIEATNSSGIARADLVVDGVTLASLTSQELLALKTLLENRELLGMYLTIPVRSDAEIWEKSDDESYVSREIYEQPIMSGEKKSITKEQYILEDPNISKIKDSSGYKPQIATRDTPLKLGDWTSQLFSGEWTHHKRANLLKRRDVLYSSVIQALKEANEVQCVQSGIKAESIFSYLHEGKI